MSHIDHTKPPQSNGCYCVERHSTPREIALAFAACKHPKGEQLRVDAAGVAVQNGVGLLICCHCGAHQRTSDGAWVYGHLAASASHAGQVIAMRAKKRKR